MFKSLYEVEHIVQCLMVQRRTLTCVPSTTQTAVPYNIYNVTKSLQSSSQVHQEKTYGTLGDSKFVWKQSGMFSLPFSEEKLPQNDQ